MTKMATYSKPAFNGPLPERGLKASVYYVKHVLTLLAEEGMYAGCLGRVRKPHYVYICILIEKKP